MPEHYQVWVNVGPPMSSPTMEFNLRPGEIHLLPADLPRLGKYDAMTIVRIRNTPQGKPGPGVPRQRPGVYYRIEAGSNIDLTYRANDYQIDNAALKRELPDTAYTDLGLRHRDQPAVMP